MPRYRKVPNQGEYRKTKSEDQRGGLEQRRCRIPRSKDTNRKSTRLTMRTRKQTIRRVEEEVTKSRLRCLESSIGATRERKTKTSNTGYCDSSSPLPFPIYQKTGQSPVHKGKIKRKQKEKKKVSLSIFQYKKRTISCLSLPRFCSHSLSASF